MPKKQYIVFRAELVDEEYHGFHYRVKNFGTSWSACVCVDVTELGKRGCDIGIIKGLPIGWACLPILNCISWMPENPAESPRRRTTAEIVAECKDIIDQIAEMAGIAE